jgi:hypothetical protein
MPDSVHYVLIGVIAVVFVLFVLARRFPHIDWLQHFRLQRPYDSSRDRHLDNAWMTSGVVPPRRGTFRETMEDARKEFREFRAAMPQLPPEEKAKGRRRSKVYGGAQLILLGIALPFGFHILKMMLFFSSVSRTETIILYGLSGTCVIAGIIAIMLSGKD